MFSWGRAWLYEKRCSDVFRPKIDLRVAPNCNFLKSVLNNMMSDRDRKLSVTYVFCFLSDISACSKSRSYRIFAYRYFLVSKSTRD